MRIVYAKFKGYVGFNAVMGLEELEIDLSRSTHQICLIVGMNGVGKSTLLSALNIFPDNNNVYMKNRDGSKLLRLVDNNNFYEIEIISPFDGKGGRKTTKAFIRLNGVELNPNGNISSYKEIISNEFELDSNFISLSMMTSVDRGLGDKTPAERKKFVSAVIENLVTYNNMYKTFNKKALMYKSHINTLHTKIQTAGDKQVLESTLKQLESQQTEIEKNIEDLNKQIVYTQAKSEIDPEEAKIINGLNTKKNELESKINSVQSSIDLFYNNLKIKPEDVVESYEKDKELLEVYTKSMNDSTSEWKNKQEQLGQMSNTINTLKASIANTNQDTKLENAYAISTNTIHNLETNLVKLKIDKNYIDRISRIKDLIKFFNEFIQRVDSLYTDLTSEDVGYIVYEYANTDIKSIQSTIESYTLKISEYKNKIDDCNKDLKLLSVLDQRPDKCNIDSCPFINEAYNLSTKVSRDEIVEELSTLHESIINSNTEIDRLTSIIHRYQSFSSKYIEYQMIVNMVNNLDIVFESGYYYNLITCEMKDLDCKLSKMYSFNSFRDLRDIIDGLNILQEYESEYKNNEILKAQYLAYRDKLKVVETTRNTISSLEKDSEFLVSTVAELKNKIDKYKDLIAQLQKSCNSKSQYADKVKEISEYYNQMSIIDIELQKFEKKSYISANSLNIINDCTNKINECKAKLDPVKNQISDIHGRLTLLDSYYREYEQYNENYQFIEILKKYCSPTGGGIQTVFMQMYMAKTLQLSNQILGMLFGGAYRLIDFIINENEFRIPFMGPNGIPVDDISSGSNSQICMFGMVINLVLLHQASNKFNIAYLDEIDGGLDHRNRFDFINALYNAIPMLGIDQIFMISHSMEADMSNVDIIKLKTYNDFEDVMNSGNIIFDFKNYTSNYTR